MCTGNGYITTTVLREILKELDDKLTAQDLDLMIEEIDSDGSGTVDFDGKLHEGRYSCTFESCLFQRYTFERNWRDIYSVLRRISSKLQDSRKVTEKYFHGFAFFRSNIED